MLPSDSFSAIKISNKSRSYADAYTQVNELRASVAAPTLYSAHTDDLGVVGQTQDSDTAIELPVRVANKTLAAQVANGESTDVTYGDLEKCAAIYPNGEFAWDNPTAGTQVGGPDRCTAVVEMRGYQMGPDGTDLVLARANVAAGDTVRCNISDWSEYSYLPAAGTITFPYDNEPTVEDVIAQMNQEQKQHAGLKIAAGTLIAAVAGNAIGANEVGSDSLLGTNKEKMHSAAIGGLTGAAIMAGNVYAGKVAGDMILSAGVNAAAGGLIGNMAASGDRLLRLENCTKDKNTKTCDLWGVLVESGSKENNIDLFYNTSENRVYSCSNLQGCKIYDKRLEDIILQGYCCKEAQKENENNACTPATDWGTTCHAIIENNITYDNIEKIKDREYEYASTRYKFKDGEDGNPTKELTEDNSSGTFIKIVKATIIDGTTPAMYVGYTGGDTEDDWNKFKQGIDLTKANIKGRQAKGEPRELNSEEKEKKSTFRPLYQDAEDGALIDFNNKARTKSTVIGAGAGGALGAFTAYQGAQTEIQERWVTAVREYKDSLQKVYCATGNRFLSHYNDTVLIPNITE